MTMPVVHADPANRAGTDEQLRIKSLVVLVADSVSRAAQGEADNEDAGRETKGRRNGLAAEVIRLHRGQVFKTIGDSFMAEFADPADAVRAALDLQCLLMESPQESSESDLPQLRIGIHGLIGDCKRLDLFAGVIHAAVNIAQHADPGQILASREVSDALLKETDLGFQWFLKIAIGGRNDYQDVFEVHLAAAPEGVPSRYEAAFQVGTGGMGVVYQARDRETGETVALKVLKSDIAADPAMQENLRREVCLARKVTHKNVCRIHEFNRSGGVAYISMEFVEGASLLATLQRSGPLPWGEALKIVRQVCAGLGEAHAQGIVHRDLKPANIMVDRNGVAKIMDFGIARPFQASSQTTGTLAGTPAYMAPEQVEVKGADARTDIYALGLLLYEMVTGSQAFQGDTPIAVAIKQLREYPTPAREIVPSLPLGAESVILKCIQKDPNKRFQSTAELVFALRSSLQAKAEMSLWSSFIVDLRHSGRDLRRDLQPWVEAVGQFFLRIEWRFPASKRAQRALAAGLGAACLLSVLVFFALRHTRTVHAIDSASAGTSAVIANLSSRPVLPTTAATEESVGAGAPESDQDAQESDSSTQDPDASAQASDPSLQESEPSLEGTSSVVAEQPAGTDTAAAGSELGSHEKSQLDPRSSTRPRPGSSAARIGQNQKTQRATGNPATSPAALSVVSAPATTELQPSLPATSVAKTDVTSTQQAEATPPPSSASVVPSAPQAAADKAVTEDKATGDDVILSASYFEVGSFKESASADDAVEKLTKLGFRAASVHKGLLWMHSYQVRVGPYTDSMKLEMARQNLVSQGFNPELVR
ncbi:MAG: protein kinase [Candidatus Acidiferrales bacterium]